MAKLRGQDPKEAKPSRPKILIYGKPGAGTTWGSLDFPSVYYIDTEGGANLDHYTDKLKKAGGAYLGPDQGANDFGIVTEEIISLATTQHKFKTLVIDSFTKLFNTQVTIDYERMEKGGRDMDKTFGAEKKGAINFTRKWLRWFEKLDMNVILICHEKSQWKDGKEVGVTFDGWDKLEYELHLCMNIMKQGQTRRARITKSRLKQFSDAETFDWSYAEFAKRFGQDVIESEAKPVIIASADQVKKLEMLLDILKTDSEITEKWKEKAGVETWAEMQSDDIDKCINFLTGKLPKTAA
jgi:hypothetical protein